MDQTLLHEQDRETAVLPRHTNNEVEREYRELEVEPPQPAIHLGINPPHEFDGESYSELIFDYDAMTGKDFLRAEREFVHRYKPEKNETFVIPESKHLYHEIIAAHRANVPLGVIQSLPRRYYVPVRTEALKACGSSPEKEE
jgi:hypothetical protein